jgi:2-hydroxy-6-oxonona-2,4-dienedioate hydrolase
LIAKQKLLFLICDVKDNMKLVAIILGFILLLLGGLWLLQGLGIVHVRPILCFADCAPMQGPSPTWAAIGAITLTTSGLLILWSSKRPPKARHARSFRQRHPLLIGIGLGVSVIVAMIWWRFQSDIEAAHARVSHGSVLIETACGPIEYQDAGTGIPLLSVHGSGGGFDQGMAFAAPLTKQGIRVIAMSRFGYLRTPMPTNASAEAQADAHVCLLDALGIRQAAVMGGSAGAPSALQMAIRHPERVSGLILLVPLAYKPPTNTDSAPPLSPWVENTMMRVIGSDFLFWAGSYVARNQVIKVVLATPPELLKSANPAEQARVNAMLDTILPVSARAAGLRSDSAMEKSLTSSPLHLVRAPTLIISARDDGYGTYASAEYTASQITGAKFIGFETGGHTWVGHNDEVMTAILELISPEKQKPKS